MNRSDVEQRKSSFETPVVAFFRKRNAIYDQTEFTKDAHHDQDLRLQETSRVGILTAAQIFKDAIRTFEGEPSRWICLIICQKHHFRAHGLTLNPKIR